MRVVVLLLQGRFGPTAVAPIMLPFAAANFAIPHDIVYLKATDRQYKPLHVNKVL